MFATSRRIKLLTLGALCFALFMAMLDNTVVNVALPRIQQHLGSGVSGLQWIIDAYTLVFASFMLTGGTLGDIFGRKRFFLAGLAVFTAGSLLCALAPSLAVLIAGRGVQGLGAAALLPGTLSILTNTFLDPRERAQAIGIWAGISGLALAAGPIVGGSLVDSFGWQSVFYLNVPIGIVALVVASLVIHESRDPEGRRLDLPGQALAIIALGSLTYALIEANNFGWTSLTILCLFALAIVAMAAFLWVEFTRPSPMLQLKFFRNPTFAAAAACAGIISFGLFGMFFFMSLFFQNVQDYTPFQAGLRTLPATAVIVVVAPLAGRIAARIGSKVPMATGLALNATSLFLFTAIDATTSYAHIWPLLLLAGTGMGLVMTPMTAAVMGAVPPQRAGMASATSNASREIGGVFGIALLGAIVTHVFSRDLSRTIAALRLPAGLKALIIRQASHGAEQAVTALPPGVKAAALHAAAGAAFVAGMHVAMIVAGGALALGALAALVFVQGGRGMAKRAPSNLDSPRNALATVGEPSSDRYHGHDICSAKHARWLALPLRRLVHNPQRILSAFVTRGDSVIDIGCGPGFFSLPLAHLVGDQGHIIAVDLQPEMLALLRRRATRAGMLARIDLRHGPADSLGDVEPADFALAFYVVHELPDVARFFSEVHRVLKAQGRLLLVEPKGRVSTREYAHTLDFAVASGLIPVAEPHIAFSRVTLLVKDS
ncbi:MAG: DHA2 family efflux MFS transporter permease subunit [Thermoleophilia bacterium]